MVPKLGLKFVLAIIYTFTGKITFVLNDMAQLKFFKKFLTFWLMVYASNSVKKQLF